MQLWNYVSNREQQLSFIPIERHIVYNDSVTVQEFWMTMWEQKVYTIYSRKWKVLDDNWKLCFGNLPLTERITSRTELFGVGMQWLKLRTEGNESFGVILRLSVCRSLLLKQTDLYDLINFHPQQSHWRSVRFVPSA